MVNKELNQALELNQAVAVHMADGSYNWVVVTREGTTLMDVLQSAADEKQMAVTGYRLGRVVTAVEFG